MKSFSVVVYFRPAAPLSVTRSAAARLRRAMDSTSAANFIYNSLIPGMTGGLVFDTSAGHGANTARLYTWIALLVVPLAFTLASAYVSLGGQLAYAFATAGIILLFHIINMRLHRVCDTTNPSAVDDLTEEPLERVRIEAARPPPTPELERHEQPPRRSRRQHSSRSANRLRSWFCLSHQLILLL